MSAGRLLTARTPSSVTLSHQWRLSVFSAVQLLTTARTPSSVMLRHQVRSRNVSEARLLTARSPWSVNTATPPPLLTSSDTTIGNRRTSLPTASSVVCGLSTSRVTIASCTAFHAAHTSRTAANAWENPKPPSSGLLGPSGCSASSTFSNSSSGMPAHPSSSIVSRSRCDRVRGIVAGAR